MKILQFKKAHNIVGPLIKVLRRKKGLTQDQVVAQMQIGGIQIDQKAISRIENGERIITDYELMRLAEILDKSADQILKEAMEKWQENE